MKTSRLPQTAIKEIFEIVSELQLDREALWVGIGAIETERFHALAPTVKTADTYAAQLLVDLGTLNAIDHIDGGLDPFRRWLENAVLLAKPRSESRRLQVYARLLERKSGVSSTNEGDPKLTTSHSGSSAGGSAPSQPSRPLVDVRIVASFSLIGATVGLTLQVSWGSPLLLVIGLVIVALVLLALKLRSVPASPKASSAIRAHTPRLQGTQLLVAKASASTLTSNPAVSLIATLTTSAVVASGAAVGAIVLAARGTDQNMVWEQRHLTVTEPTALSHAHPRPLTTTAQSMRFKPPQGRTTQGTEPSAGSTMAATGSSTTQLVGLTPQAETTSERAAALYRQAMQAAQQGDYSTAVDRLRSANELYTHWQIQLNLGFCLQQLGQVDEARQYLELVVETSDEPNSIREAERLLEGLSNSTGSASKEGAVLREELPMPSESQ